MPQQKYLNYAVSHQTNKDLGVLQFQFLLLLMVKLILLSSTFCFARTHYTVPDQCASLQGVCSGAVMSDLALFDVVHKRSENSRNVAATRGKTSKGKGCARGDACSTSLLSAGVILTKCITCSSSRACSERGRCVKMWFEITGLVKPPEICNNKDDRTSLLCKHRWDEDGCTRVELDFFTVSHNWARVASFSSNSQPQLNMCNVQMLTLYSAETMIRSYFQVKQTEPPTLPLPFLLGHARSREGGREGGSGSALSVSG